MKNVGMGLYNVIKYEGDNDTLIWKHPKEDFNINTQLIVDESQEALFYNGGEALNLFGPGTHTLSTNNYPFLGTLLKKLGDGSSPFHCKVYFINKAELMAVRWGTPDKINVWDEGVSYKLGAGGDMSLVISDARKLILKVVGTESSLTKDTLSLKLKEMLNSWIGDFLANTVRELNVGLLNLDQHKREFSERLRQLLLPEYEKYGISIEQFNLSRFVLPEDDQNFKRMQQLYADRRNDTYAKETEIDLKMKDANLEASVYETIEMKKAEVAAKTKIMDAQANAAKREAEGYTYQEEQGFNVAGKFAEGMGSNEIANLGMSLGAVAGVGNGVGAVLGGNINAALTAVTAPQAKAGGSEKKMIKCAKCGTELPENAKFCFGCGEKVVVVKEDSCICPSCGKVTPKGKFCMECGAPLIRICPNCGKEVPPDGKFCLECGTKLTTEEG